MREHHRPETLPAGTAKTLVDLISHIAAIAVKEGAAMDYATEIMGVDLRFRYERAMTKDGKVTGLRRLSSDTWDVSYCPPDNRKRPPEEFEFYIYDRENLESDLVAFVVGGNWMKM